MVEFVGYTTVGQTVVPKRLQDAEVAKQDLLNNFYTRRGERVMDPEYGSIIPFLVFEPLDEQTRNSINRDIDKIVNLDPRWKVLERQLIEDDHSITIVLRLKYMEIQDTELLLSYERYTR